MRSAVLDEVERLDGGVARGRHVDVVLRTAFQPIFAFHGTALKPVAFEALLRPMRDGKTLRPDQYLASLAGGERTAVETLSRTIHIINAGACLEREALVFLNLDPSLVVEGSAAAALRDIRLLVHAAGLEPGRLVFEVTESATLDDQALFALVEALRGQGYRIAIDDFGADHSDIHRFDALKPELVKFDAAWVATLMSSGTGFAMLADLVARFDGAGVSTVLEGIEAGWQLDLAEKAGATMVQGYRLARPRLATALVPAPLAAPVVEDLREPGGRAAPIATPRPFGRRIAMRG